MTPSKPSKSKKGKAKPTKEEARKKPREAEPRSPYKPLSDTEKRDRMNKLEAAMVACWPKYRIEAHFSDQWKCDARHVRRYQELIRVQWKAEADREGRAEKREHMREVLRSTIAHARDVLESGAAVSRNHRGDESDTSSQYLQVILRASENLSKLDALNEPESKILKHEMQPQSLVDLVDLCKGDRS